MTQLWKCAALVVLSSGLVWAQSINSEHSAQPKEGATDAVSNAKMTNSTASKAPASIPDSTKLEILRAQKADYPLAASSDGIQGEVWIRFHITEAGDVDAADVISGNPVLAQSALMAAKKFKFKPYIRNGSPVQVTTKLPFDFYFRGNATEVKQESVVISPVHSASAKNAEGNLPQRVKVSAGVMAGLLIHKVQPVYPQSAKDRGIQGAVVIRVVIGKDGRLKDLKPISGPMELVEAAVGAVQQWGYRPYFLLGNPVEVDTQITVNFQFR